MDWHLPELLSIWHHLPRAQAHLESREDAALVKQALSGFQRLEVRPSEVLALEKSMDPSISRTEANIGLLVRDYLRSLPGFHASDHASQALVEHWRKLLLEQPRRLAEAHLESWNDERTQSFWKERLSHFRTDVPGVDFQLDAEDWERAAGMPAVHPQLLGHTKEKQWQDLVIRQRLHLLDMKNMSR